jgi:predicted DNA-binding transcriptional regulator AlpA
VQNQSDHSTLDQIIRPRPLAQRLAVSTTTLWRMRRLPKHPLPEPIQISKGAKGWRESTIQQWLSERERT